jgi:hypothetical protein
MDGLNSSTKGNEKMFGKRTELIESKLASMEGVLGILAREMTRLQIHMGELEGRVAAMSEFRLRQAIEETHSNPKPKATPTKDVPFVIACDDKDKPTPMQPKKRYAKRRQIKGHSHNELRWAAWKMYSDLKASGKEKTFKELAQMVGLPKHTVYRIITKSIDLDIWRRVQGRNPGKYFPVKGWTKAEVMSVVGHGNKD